MKFSSAFLEEYSIMQAEEKARMHSEMDRTVDRLYDDTFLVNMSTNFLEACFLIWSSG